MPRTNDEVEAILTEYAELLAISGGDPYKPRSYEKAARSIGGYHADLKDLDQKGLLAIPNVGMSIPGLGPKKAMALHDELGIGSIEELMDAVHENRLEGVKGFSKKTEENILRGVRQLQEAGQRVQIGVALDLAEEMLAELGGLRAVEQCCYAGSLRRMVETIGDIDLLVASEKPGPVMDAFTSLSYVEHVLAKGETKSSVRTTKGLQVDLRVVEPGVWGAALQYFTGSKAHNIRTREIAVRKGLKLSEYGLFDAESGDLIVAETEAEVYERLGLPWIPPTLREDRGEIEAALHGELPTLVELKDLRGDLHTHTNLTDGLSTLEQMLETAAGLTYAYYAITDHAPNLYMQQMTDEKMLSQRDRVRKLQSKYPKMALLHGSELNIDPAGEVDWPPEFLEGFDVCVASVHSHFNQSKDDMTKRIVRACENPYVNVIGHPTARMIGRRPPIDYDLDEVFQAAARTGTALEVNSFPDRLDLKDEHILWARRHGVKFAIDTDSHSTVHLAFMRFGVGTAQRGWLTKDDVINTWPITKLRKFVEKKR